MTRLILTFTLLISVCFHMFSQDRQERFITIDRPIRTTQRVVYNSEVIIHPGAFLSTEGDGLFVFNAKVHFLSDLQCMDPDVNIDFAVGALDRINPCWFGARGYDDLDDTRAVEKAVTTANHYRASIPIIFPSGKYYINKTLNIESDPRGKKGVHLQGSSHSNTGVQGSSIIWHGQPDESMFVFRNVNQFQISNIDFTAQPGHFVRHNLEFRPSIHQVTIQNCRFKGSAGPGSSNVNLNIDDTHQVSEFHFQNCSFSGEWEGEMKVTESAVRGGRANTKNFHFRDCAFSSYNRAAINVHHSDVLQVDGCTFSHNDIDIKCDVCGTYANSNYSEHSNAFFEGASTSNVSFTTLINNLFSGNPKDGFVIRDGSGSLIVLNNNFGGAGDTPDNNRIRWESKPFNSIYSIGNFLKNTSQENPPFYNRSNQPTKGEVIAIETIGGGNSVKRKKIKYPK